MYNYDYNSLYHHGVKGMKWGVRKQQPKSARYYKKTLNKLDKQAANKIGDYIYNDAASKNTAQQIRIKTDSLNYKGKNTSTNKQLTKMKSKLTEQQQRAAASKKDLINIEKQQFKVIADAVNNGYSVVLTDAMRTTKRGTLASLASSAAFGVVLGEVVMNRKQNKYSGKYTANFNVANKANVTVDQSPYMVKGVKFTVK